ncbi:MAG: hypothetical protein AB1767_07350 [Bacillota bacterium]
MTSRIIIHHSCCGEVPSETGCRCTSHGGYLVHADGLILKLPERLSKPAGAAGRTINIILVGYFNSVSRINSMDRRQFYSLTELLRRFLDTSEELFGQPLYHHHFCPGHRFPREELEWCLWNMLA